MKTDFRAYATVNDLITGSVIINKNIQYNNIYADTVIIEPFVTARLFGKIRDYLILKKGSTLYLHGSIHGNVENNGGVLHVFSPDHK